MARDESAKSLKIIMARIIDLGSKWARHGGRGGVDEADAPIIGLVSMLLIGRTAHAERSSSGRWIKNSVPLSH